MKNIEKLNDEELIEFVRKLNKIENPTTDEINLYMKALNYLKIRMLKKKEQNRIDKVNNSNSIYESEIERLETPKKLSHRDKKYTSIVLKNHINDGIYKISNILSYMGYYGDLDERKRKNIFVKYSNAEDPYSFEELVTKRKIPMSFDVNVNDRLLNPYTVFASALKLPNYSISGYGGKRPDPMSIKVDIEDSNRMFELADGTLCDPLSREVKKYLDEDPNEINSYLNSAYDLGLKRKYDELSKKENQKIKY